MPTLSWDEVAAVAIKAGWPPGDAVYAVAITEPESARDSTVIQANQPYATTGWGLWQITPGNSVPQFGINKAMLDPLNNARAGHYKWAAAGGFSPWTTYENRLEIPYLPAAEAAVRHVTGLSKTDLDKLVRDARAGDATAAGAGLAADDWSAQIRGTSRRLRTTAVHMASYGRLAGSLHPSFTPPDVSPPDPATLLWRPPTRRRP
jgi:hypothetical protein